MRKFRYFILTKSIGLYINLLSLVHAGKAKSAVFYFFSKPRDGKLKPDALPELLANTHRETISLNGDTIQTYTWKGNGAVVMLAHGWDSNSWRWEKFLPYLKQAGCTIVALDAPDHGLSRGSFSLPKYAAFIDAAAKKFEPDYLVGHSLGGSASLFYQYTYRNPKLQKLVMLGSPADLNPIINNYRNLLSLTPRAHRLLSDYFVENFNFHPDEYAAGIFTKDFSLSGFIAHDTTDTVVLVQESEKIVSSWKGARLVTTTGFGHSLHSEELYKDVADFLFA